MAREPDSGAGATETISANLRSKDRTRAPRGKKSMQSALGVMLGCRVYWVLLLMRLALCGFLTVMDRTEAMDGADVLAGMLLPESGFGGGELPKDISTLVPTRGIVGAALSSGVPYFAYALYSAWAGVDLDNDWMWTGFMAVALPRIWMFGLSLVLDYLVAMVFRRMEQESAQPSLLVMATSWVGLVAICRPSGFAIEAICLAGVLAASCAFTAREPVPLFLMSAFFLCTGMFVRPVFGVFVFTPLIYLSSLLDKPGFSWIRYTQALMLGVAMFAFWATVYVTIDSIFFGKFKLFIGGEQITSVPVLLDLLQTGGKFSYKGSLVITPLNAIRNTLSVSFWRTLPTRTSPGQIFLSLPALIGPLFFVLVRDSVEGMKVALKDLRGQLKTKKKKKKSNRPSAQKEKEEESAVFFDTLQTTLLLGLLLEVMQNNERIGTLSLLALMVPTACCVGKSVFGDGSSRNFRYLHIGFAIAGIVIYGMSHQSGVPRTMYALSKNGLPEIKPGTDIVVYRGMIGHHSLLGANRKNITFHGGGDDIKSLMGTIRRLKSRKGFREDRLLILAADTVRNLRESEWERVSGVGGLGHLSILDMPANLDEAVSKSRWSLLKFLGDEDETEIRDNEERAEEEERQQAEPEL